MAFFFLSAFLPAILRLCQHSPKSSQAALILAPVSFWLFLRSICSPYIYILAWSAWQSASFLTVSFRTVPLLPWSIKWKKPQRPHRRPIRTNPLQIRKTNKNLFFILQSMHNWKGSFPIRSNWLVMSLIFVYMELCCRMFELAVFRFVSFGI